MPYLLLIVSQSDYLIQVVDIYSHTKWQTGQIQISWLFQKPTDLDLHYLQRQGISGFSRTRVNIFILVTFTCFDAVYTTVSAAINTESSCLFPDPSVPTDSLPLCAFSRQYSCKSGQHELSSISRYDWERFARYVMYFSSSGYMHTATLHMHAHTFTQVCVYIQWGVVIILHVTRYFYHCFLEITKGILAKL